MKKAARTAVAGVALAALALTGCATSPSNAATVEGVRIADSTVQQVAQGLVAASGAEASVMVRQATYDLVLGEASRQMAASTGTPVSAADQRAVLEQYPAAAAVAATPEGAPWGDAVTMAFVMQERLGVDQFLVELGELDITINPRYGQWDATRGTFSDASLARLADPTTLRS